MLVVWVFDHAPQMLLLGGRTAFALQLATQVSLHPTGTLHLQRACLGRAGRLPEHALGAHRGPRHRAWMEGAPGGWGGGECMPTFMHTHSSLRTQQEAAVAPHGARLPYALKTAT